MAVVVEKILRLGLLELFPSRWRVKHVEDLTPVSTITALEQTVTAYAWEMFLAPVGLSRIRKQGVCELKLGLLTRQ
jgi:hypothetical protein